MKRVDNIILIGFMGSGKSSVGKLLANKVNYDFMDTDELIEVKQGTTISEIFSTNGEEYFRDLETDLLLSLKDKMRKTVLSTGGGMPIRDKNIKLLRKMGQVIYLSASKNTIIERVSKDTSRPLLNVNNIGETVDRLLGLRIPIYEKAADIIINTDKFSLEDIVAKILQALNHIP
ncbi:MAG: shikimate kinase [Clostridiales bacterium]|nr:shikimate kinase [Clostridiales bacterium]